MKPRIKVGFNLFGDDVDPDEITDAIGLKPTRAFRKGDILQITTLGAKQVIWCLEVDWEETELSAPMLSRLVDRIKPHLAKIKDAQKKWNLQIQFSIVIEAARCDLPEIYFEPDIVQVIAELNASIDAEAYRFPEEE